MVVRAVVVVPQPYAGEFRLEVLVACQRFFLQPSLDRPNKPFDRGRSATGSRVPFADDGYPAGVVPL